MNSQHRMWIFLVSIVAATAAGCTDSPTGREKGIQEAKHAIAEGKLRLKEYPPTPYPPDHDEYVAVLEEKFNVGYEVVSSPRYSEELMQEVWGWNETMRKAMEDRYGPSVFGRIEKEAENRWKAKSSKSKTEETDNGQEP